MGLTSPLSSLFSLSMTSITQLDSFILSTPPYSFFDTSVLHMFLISDECDFEYDHTYLLGKVPVFTSTSYPDNTDPSDSGNLKSNAGLVSRKFGQFLLL